MAEVILEEEYANLWVRFRGQLSHYPVALYPTYKLTYFFIVIIH